MERVHYPTDLPDAQWNILRRLLVRRNRRGAPQRICRRRIINAILYLLRSGCAWRLLPRDFPNWKTVYGVFFRWRNDGTWKRINAALMRMVARRPEEGPLPLWPCWTASR